MKKEKAMEIIKALRENKVMSHEDLENLSFLLCADRETMMDWYQHVDEDDIEYAKNILAIARDYFNDDAITMDVTQAKQVLKRFML